VVSSKCLILAKANKALYLLPPVFSPRSYITPVPPPSCSILLYIKLRPASPNPRARRALILVIAFSIMIVSY
jgi:hypothetical protein